MPAVTRPVERTLGWIRVVVGAIFLVRGTPLIHALPGLYQNHGGPLFGWPTENGVRAAVLGLLLPIGVVKALVVIRAVAGFAFMIGLRARLAGIVAAGSAYLVYAQEPFGLIFTLHVLYTSVLLLACTDATAHVAVRPDRPVALDSSLWLLRGWSASIYAFSGLAKLGAAWWSGRTLTVLYQQHFAEGFLADLTLRTGTRAAITAVVVAVLELGLPAMLYARRTRYLALALACAMHAGFELTMHPDVFGWVMVTLLSAWWVDERDHLPIAARHPAPDTESKQ